MKILWFTWKDRDHPLTGGAEVVNEELAKRLAADGHEVVFIVAGFPKAPKTTERDGFRIVRVGSRYTSYLAAFTEYRRHWRGWADILIDECNTMPYFTSLYSGEKQFLFFHMLNRQIWFHEFPPGLSHAGFLAEPVYLRLLKRSVPVITVSESTKQDLMRHGFRPGNIHIISEGIEIEPVPALNNLQKYDQPTMLSFGSVRPMKRTLHQLQAFELAKAKLPNLRLIVAGDASSAYGQKFARAVRRSKYSSDIEVLGPVTKERKIELMQKSHLIAVTSVKEGWGLIVTEAASQGCPAVVYNVDGLRDSVRDHHTGLITQRNTPAALARAATELLEDPMRYESTRTAAWSWSRNITFDQSYSDFLSVIAR